ncbi:cyclase/dehydrase [Duganella sp. Leaf126]|uniref:SRPBCC family protein n=1 Tax=Duganella sp. Leaf126 TaxID=1736266 RepID=UPI0006F1E930|nr:SRPBCC family protein [Duganella sp. Leaf126]KQQ32715.1 cyclase/dehydrase [Duganella sp. Leaf126]
MSRFRFLLLLILGVCAAQAGAQAAKPDTSRLEVAVNRVDVDGQHMYELDATGVVAAPLPRVWRILTNYERMTEFVPDLESCKVLSRNGNEVMIEQFGVARLLFMTQAIHLIVRATEQPMSAIDIALVSGDMKHYEARWELVPMPETGGTRVVYKGRMMPNFYVPSLFGAKMIRSDVEHMMRAVLTRLDRRDDRQPTVNPILIAPPAK